MFNARTTYIRLLERSARSGDVAQTPDWTFSGELIEEGYLVGTVGRNESGVISRSAVTGITVKGRLFLEQLRREQREESWLGRLQKVGIFLLGILVGVGVPILTSWLKAYYHLTP